MDVLTDDELATIRAALRFWKDEMVPAVEDTTRHYFDVTPVPSLTGHEIETLVGRMQSSSFDS